MDIIYLDILIVEIKEMASNLIKKGLLYLEDSLDEKQNIFENNHQQTNNEHQDRDPVHSVHHTQINVLLPLFEKGHRIKVV